MDSFRERSARTPQKMEFTAVNYYRSADRMVKPLRWAFAFWVVRVREQRAASAPSPTVKVQVWSDEVEAGRRAQRCTKWNKNSEAGCAKLEYALGEQREGVLQRRCRQHRVNATTAEERRATAPSGMNG